MKKFSFGSRILIVTFLTILVVSATFPLLRISWKVVTTSLRLYNISNKILYSEDVNDYDGVRRLNQERDTLETSDDVVTHFLATTTGTTGKRLTRFLAITLAVVLGSIAFVIDAFLLHLNFVALKKYLIYKLKRLKTWKKMRIRRKKKIWEGKCIRHKLHTQ